MLTLSSKLVLAAAVTSAFALTTQAWAQGAAQYPSRPIRAIVPFAPGGANDVVGRIMSPEISKQLGQPVVVENKPGAGGNIGLDYVAKSKPDGYTILYSATASTQNPALYLKLPFDPIKDLQPVAQIAEAPYVILANPNLPVKTAAELIEYARRNPGKLNAASGGLGTRLSVELLKIKNKLSLEIIPYNGTGPAAAAVRTGESHFAIMDTSAYVGFLAAGQVKPLAVAGEKRLASLPDVPTAREAGLGDYLSGTLFGIYVQGATPRDIVEKLNATVNRIIVTPEMTERLRKLGSEPMPRSVDNFTKYVHSEIATWKQIVKQANIPPIE
jgi:tripartite-type tricarboxylate transporter receptor subunit TctC